MSTVKTALAMNWWLPFVRGILLVLFGVIMLVMGRGVTLIAAIQFLGAYWLAGGVLDLFESVLGQSEGSRVRMAISALFSIVAGFVVLSYPHHQRHSGEHISDSVHGDFSGHCGRGAHILA